MNRDSDLTDIERRLEDYGATMRSYLEKPLAQKKRRAWPQVATAAAAIFLVLGLAIGPSLRAERDVAVTSSTDGVAISATVTPVPTQEPTAAPTEVPTAISTVIPTAEIADTPTEEPVTTSADADAATATATATATVPPTFTATLVPPTATPVSATSTAVPAEATTTAIPATTTPIPPTSTVIAAASATASTVAATPTATVAAPIATSTPAPSATPIAVAPSSTPVSTTAAATATATPTTTTTTTDPTTTTTTTTTDPTATPTSPTSTATPTTTAPTTAPTTTPTPSAPPATPTSTVTPEPASTSTGTPSPTVAPVITGYAVDFTFVAPDGSTVTPATWDLSIDGENFTPQTSQTWTYATNSVNVPVYVRVPWNGCMAAGFVQLYDRGDYVETINLIGTFSCVEYAFVDPNDAAVDGTGFVVSETEPISDDQYREPTNPRFQMIRLDTAAELHVMIPRTGCNLVGSTITPTIGLNTIVVAPATWCDGDDEDYTVNFTFIAPDGTTIVPTTWDLSINGENYSPVTGSQWIHSSVTNNVPVWVRVPWNGCTAAGFVQLYDEGIYNETMQLSGTISCLDFAFVDADGNAVDGTGFQLGDGPGYFEDPTNFRLLMRRIDPITRVRVLIPRADCDLVGAARPPQYGTVTIEVAKKQSCTWADFNVDFTFVAPDGAPVTPTAWDISIDGENYSPVTGSQWTHNTNAVNVPVYVRVPWNGCTAAGFVQLYQPGDYVETLELDGTYSCITYAFEEPDGSPVDGTGFLVAETEPIFSDEYGDPNDFRFRMRRIDSASEIFVLIPRDGCDLLGWQNQLAVGTVTFVVSPDPTCGI